MVATEVGNLSQQSQVASDNIKGIIGDIQSSAEEAIRAMADGTQKISESVGVVNEAGKAFDSIVTDINALSDKIDNSMDATNSTIQRSKDVSDVIVEMQNLANAILDKTQAISAETQEQTQSMEEVADSSHRMMAIAENLQEEVDKFNF